MKRRVQPDGDINAIMKLTFKPIERRFSAFNDTSESIHQWIGQMITQASDADSIGCATGKYRTLTLEKADYVSAQYLLRIRDKEC